MSDEKYDELLSAMASIPEKIGRAAGELESVLGEVDQALHSPMALEVFGAEGMADLEHYRRSICESLRELSYKVGGCDA
jgi:hypothetical protein